jgi:hypothetical protein
MPTIKLNNIGGDPRINVFLTYDNKIYKVIQPPYGPQKKASAHQKAKVIDINHDLAYFKIVDPKDDSEDPTEIKDFSNSPITLKIKYPAGLWKDSVRKSNIQHVAQQKLTHPRVAYLGQRNNTWAPSWIEFQYAGAEITQPLLFLRAGSLTFAITKLEDPLIGGT